MARAPGRSNISTSTVARGASGSKPGTQRDFAAVGVVRSDPPTRVGVGSRTLERVVGGLRTGDVYAGRLRSAGTTSL